MPNVAAIERYIASVLVRVPKCCIKGLQPYVDGMGIPNLKVTDGPDGELCCWCFTRKVG